MRLYRSDFHSMSWTPAFSKAYSALSTSCSGAEAWIADAEEEEGCASWK